jgi:hypothetical protein
VIKGEFVVNSLVLFFFRRSDELLIRSVLIYFRSTRLDFLDLRYPPRYSSASMELYGKSYSIAKRSLLRLYSNCWSLVLLSRLFCDIISNYYEDSYLES